MDFVTRRLGQARWLASRAFLRWKIAPDLLSYTDERVQRYYNSRLSDCRFLLDETHYERPRIEWMLREVRGGSVLEVGAGNGGMTSLLSPLADRVIALDLCQEAVEAVRALALANVEAVCGFVERYAPPTSFDWVILSEIVEHLRDPAEILRRCVTWLKPGGRVLLSTPNGEWESIEHLHEFDMATWCALLGGAGARAVSAFYIRDGYGKDRWLGGRLEK